MRWRIARIAAQHFGTDHHEYYVTPDDLVASIAKVAAPLRPALRQFLGAARLLLRPHGAGDGVTPPAGRRWRRRALRRQHALRQADASSAGTSSVPRLLRNGLLEPLFGMPASVRRLPLLTQGRELHRAGAVPMPDRLQTYNLLTRLGTEQVLTPDFLQRVDTAAPCAAAARGVGARRRRPRVDRMLAFDWRYTLAENDLPKVCGTAALAGVAVGFPLLDDDLLAFSLRLPADYKLKGLQLRWFFKEALRGFLPDEIIAKKKQGFGLPFGVWAMRHDAPAQRGRRFAAACFAARRRPTGIHAGTAGGSAARSTLATTARWSGS